MNELSIVIAMLIANFLTVLIFYSIGYKDGRSVGYAAARRMRNMATANRDAQ